MGVNATSRSPRRTQAQRSAEMRERLLDATVACLIEYGYAATTTARVVEKAGVTKGAQLHHFPSKEGLVIAAIDHLARQRAQAVIGKISRVRTSEDPASAVLEFLWESHQGPMFVATVELWVAARTNPALVHEIKRVEPLVTDTLAAAVAQLLPDHTHRKALRNAVFTAMDALHGIMLLAMVDQDPTVTRRRWDRACVDLRQIMAAALRNHPTA
ncbi:transcriptional regulator [Mycolicibacterium aromaticivorans JS19b1 = JCM 16368]|uniref:Transcriptional regulator n=1 Tax=Mycolicibacterium aromaticivorans JS19b1 = JCM 16368 TaxID=1440774 RepID=A0A064CEI5_9MYCO|nr:TetR/AcrR family transcriptional regulator [Mycolicibacterium aromaticivorans]KDE98725.1 transcriptional regulator [Mycolicibacterium aromaticivorans JS19b1 = JCM 16368]